MRPYGNILSKRSFKKRWSKETKGSLYRPQKKRARRLGKATCKVENEQNDRTTKNIQNNPMTKDAIQNSVAVTQRVVWNRSIEEIAELFGCTDVEIHDTAGSHDNVAPSTEVRGTCSARFEDFRRLHDALFTGRWWDDDDFGKQIKKISELLNQGVNINARNDQGETLLLCAIDSCVEKRCQKCSPRMYCLYCGRWEVDTAGLELITFLLEKGANANIGDLGGICPIHLVAEKGRVDIMAALIDKGVDVDVRDGLGRTPLFYVFDTDLQTTKFLIERGANVNAQNNTGYSLLHRAAGHNNTEKMAYLLENGADIEVRDNKGETPLFYAIRSQIEYSPAEEDEYDDGEGTSELESDEKQNAILFLLKKGANINVRKNAGNLLTPLHYAVAVGNLETIIAIIEAGADVNAQNNRGLTPLHVAVFQNQLEIITLLIKSGANTELKANNKTVLCFALELHRYEAMRLLLEMGADVNANEEGKITLLEYAIISNNFVGAAVLLDNGGIIGAKADMGVDVTPLIYAVMCDKSEMVKFLLERGMNTNAKDNPMEMPALHCAAIWGRIEAITVLLDYGAEIDLIACGVTPLHQAAGSNQPKAVKFLIERGANIQAKSTASELSEGHNWTPLHLATDEGAIEAMVVLLEMGADIEARDRFNKTPLDYAIEKGNTEAVALLQRARHKQFLQKEH